MEKNLRHTMIGLIAFCYSNAHLSAQDSTTVFSVENKTKKVEHAFSCSFEYFGDVSSNTLGGIKSGVKYIGAAWLGFAFDIERAGGWEGGEFQISGMNTHGDGFSSELIGDLFSANNDEVGNYTFLYEVLYKQNIKNRFDISIGLQDFNTNFVSSDETLHFIHSSFGINSVLSYNLPLPVYPTTGLGLEFGWNISDHWRWQTCIYDGLAESLDENKGNLKWKLNRKDGYLIATEVHLTNEKAGNLKLGSHFLTSTKQFGFYASGDHPFNETVTLFSKFAFAPKKRNEIFAMLCTGVNFHSIFAKRYEDVLGIGCISNLQDNEEKHETIIELTYKYQALRMLYIQPDIQYILNPSSEANLKNALAIILRVGFVL